MSSWRCFPFVDSAPRAYRLKASNAAPSSSTSTGTFRRDVVCNNSVKMSAHHLPDDTAIARSAHGLQQMRSRRRRSPAGLEPARHPDASRLRSADQADMTARATARDRRTAAVKQIGILPHLRALLDTTPPAN